MFSVFVTAIFFGTLAMSFALVAHPVRPVHPF